MKKIRLFALKGGVELMDKDFMFAVHGHKYLFYSMGKPDFDNLFFFQVRILIILLEWSL
jgi:hypothetical protein